MWHFDEKISTKPTTITVPAGITLLFQLLYTTHIENDLNEKEHFISSLMMKGVQTTHHDCEMVLVTRRPEGPPHLTPIRTTATYAKCNVL